MRLVSIVALTIELAALGGCSNLRATPPQPPELCVRVAAPGMSSLQAELEVARPLDHAVMKTPGLTHLRSRSSAAQIEPRLTVQTAIDARLQQLRAEPPASVRLQSFAFTPSKPEARRESWVKQLLSRSSCVPPMRWGPGRPRCLPFPSS